MQELDGTFRIVKADSRRVALRGDALDAQVAGAPHFVKNHLRVGGFENFLYCLLGNPQYLVLLVVGADAGHLLRVTDITGSRCLFPSYPQLTKVNGTSIEVRNSSHPQLALFFPVGNAQAAADDCFVASYSQAAVFWAQL